MSDKTKPKTTPAPAATPTEERTIEVDHSAAEAKATAAEMQRGISIRAIGKQLKCDDKLVDEHIAKPTTTADEFRKIAIDAFEADEPDGRADAGRVSVTAGDDARDKWLRGTEHWLIQRSATGHIITDAAKLRGETVRLDPGEFRGMTLMGLAREALERSGVKTRGLDIREVAARALTMRGGFQAVGDFPVLLENVLHKTLQSQFAITEDTWRHFCAIGSVPDFRASNRYRTATLNVLPIVLEGAEYQNQAQPDGEKESITAGKRGSIVEFTREMLINDDMSAFSSLATSMGRAAALTVESAVYTTLALNSNLGPDLNDGNPLFDATHSNLGAGAALSSAAIDADSAIMEAQTLPGSVEIASIRPKVLLIARALRSTAIAINEAEFDPDTTGKLTPNTTNGMFDIVIATTRVTGTRRYLFANPMDAPVLEVAFLNGQQNPFLENENGFRRDGVSWKVRLDFGVAGVGERGAVTDAGV